MEHLHIALAFDGNYLEHALVLIASILANKNDEDKIFFHIVDGGLDDISKKLLSEIKGCIIEFHQVDNQLFSKYKKTDYYSISMLYSMILPSIIDVDRLIYLDCDVIVKSSLNEIWQACIEDNYIAAVEDANGKKYIKKFGLKQESKFFNSGVMLLNCKKWKEDNISERAVKFSMANVGTRLCLDQTVLNILFEGKITFLDLKWNLQYCPINVWPTYENEEEYKNAIKNPSVIHYVGDYKPWKKGLGCFNPKQADYLKYHKLTSYVYPDYKKWVNEDRAMAYKGIVAFIKRYPVFFLKKQFWRHLIHNSL